MSSYSRKILFHPLSHLDFIKPEFTENRTGEECLKEFIRDEENIYKKYQTKFFTLTTVSAVENFDVDEVFMTELLEELKHHIVERRELITHFAKLRKSIPLKELRTTLDETQKKLVTFLILVKSDSYNPWTITDMLLDIQEKIADMFDYLDGIIKIDLDESI